MAAVTAVERMSHCYFMVLLVSTKASEIRYKLEYQTVEKLWWRRGRMLPEASIVDWSANGLSRTRSQCSEFFIISVRCQYVMSLYPPLEMPVHPCARTLWCHDCAVSYTVREGHRRGEADSGWRNEWLNMLSKFRFEIPSDCGENCKKISGGYFVATPCTRTGK